MDRYKILLGRPPFRTAFKFKPSHSVNGIYRCMEKCIKEGTVFDATNMPVGILDAAVVDLSKTYAIPIIVETEEMARALRIAHGYHRIFSLENIPDDGNCVICYGTVPSPGVRVHLNILKPKSDSG